MKAVKIRYEDLEDANFLLGLRLAHAMSNNYHKRIELTRIERKLKRDMREPMAEKQDIVREFGDQVLKASRQYPAGKKQLELNIDGMEAEKAKACIKALYDWRDKTLEFDFGGTHAEGLLELELFKEDIAEFPPQCLAVMVEYVYFKEAAGENPNKDKKRIRELELAVRAAQASASTEGE